MKKLSFLIFTALVIISASISIIVGSHIDIAIGSIIGFVCSLAIAVHATNENNEKKQKDKKEETSVGGIIGISIGIGAILALLAGMMFNSPMGALFSFIGSVLGAVVGCMYENGEHNYPI
jgi:amino acid permease